MQDAAEGDRENEWERERRKKMDTRRGTVRVRKKGQMHDDGSWALERACEAVLMSWCTANGVGHEGT